MTPDAGDRGSGTTRSPERFKELAYRFWPFASAAVSGLLLALCFAPVGWGDLAWFALLPLVVAVWFGPQWSRREWARLLLLGFVCGAVYFGGSLSWLTTLTAPGWALLSLYLAVYPALWVLLLGIMGRPRADAADPDAAWLRSFGNLRVAVVAAAAWVSLEWLRGLVFSGFGWNGLGVALNKNIPLIQIADFAGVGGVSFLAVMVNVMLVATGKRLLVELRRGARRPHYDFALTLALIALAWGYGVRQMFAPHGDVTRLSFAAVQGNVPQATRNNPTFEQDVLDLYHRYTEIAIAKKPDLILWPESAPPRPVFNDQNTWDTVKSLAEKHDGDFLFGTVYFSEQGDYNSVALLTARGSSAQMYHKMHLVPFGEFVPFRKAFPLFAWVVGDLVPDDFDPGPYATVLEMTAKPVRIAPLVCFEDTLGDLARRFAKLGAQVFVVVTNDGWFQKSAGSQQHLDNAVFRAAEMKLPMIRAANTGVTCVIDRFGAVRSEFRSPENGSTFIEGVFFNSVDVPVSPALTFYARHGEVFSAGCTVVTVAACGVWFVRRRRRSEDSACPTTPEPEV